MTVYLVRCYFKILTGCREYGPFEDRSEAERCVTALAGKDEEFGNIKIVPVEEA